MSNELSPKGKYMPDDLSRMEKEIRELGKQVDGVMEKVDLRNDSLMELEEDLKLTLMLLKGNELNKEDTGLIGTVVDLKARVIKLEKFRDRAIYLIVGFSFGAGWAISDIIKRVFTK
jgi:hypothetical protein